MNNEHENNGRGSDSDGRSVTIRDIARLAGVSTATVSRLFHSPHKVQERTRKRIEAIIEEHNYVPNIYASALTTKNTMTIGLIIPTVKSSIHSSLIQSVQDTCNELGYSLIIGNTNYSVETESRLLKIMLNRRVSGIVHAGTVNSRFLYMLRKTAEHRIPSVVVWENIEDPEISSVGIDNYVAGYDATQYLIQNGHKELGILIGPYQTMNRLYQRLQGFQNCLKEYGLDYSDQRIVSLNHEVSEGARGVKLLLEQNPAITAVFAASDVLAFGALYQLQQMGLKVPDDISLIGFDNIEFSSYCIPPLTTVEVPAINMGKAAVFEMVDRIKNNRLDSKHVRLKHELIIRNSVSSLLQEK